MTDKSKRRAKQYAQQNGVSHQAAVNHRRAPLRRLVNKGEEHVEVQLEGAAQRRGARVRSKQRLADVFNIEGSGLSDREYTFALQSHLDFVVTDDDHRPLFAVEFDGPGHDSQNDSLKNALCERFHLPLARVRNQHIRIASRGLGATAWLAELYFAHQNIRDAQEEGLFPSDEPADPMSIIYDSSLPDQGRFPLSLTMAAAMELMKLWEAKKIKYRFPMHLTMRHDQGSTSCSALRVGDRAYIFASESIYLRGFGVSEGEVADGLAMVGLVNHVEAYLMGEDVAFAPDIVCTKLEEVAARGEFSGGGGGSEAGSLGDFSIVHELIDGKMRTRVVPPRGSMH